MLSEIVYNLVDNAIKYNKDGGTITVTIDSEEDHPVLRVADSGIGIPKADQERIFERFYRVDKSHSREIGGTGLGLSIVKHACVYLGANIHINSTLGVGTTVSIRFADLI
jgi:two-component system phosphate regulon sensor histidine kinase PhoR